MTEDILYDFIIGLKTGRLPNADKFSSQVATDVQKTYQDLQANEVSFDIEPDEIKMTEKTDQEGQKFTFVGKFIYGFQKQGIFHTVPGKLKTEVERRPNERGSFVFTIGQDGKVISVYESMAGNFFGQKIKIIPGSRTGKASGGKQNPKFNLRGFLIMLGLTLLVLIVKFIIEIFN